MSLGVNGSSAGAGGDLVRVGHYTGDGTTGAANARSITFDKKPTLIMIMGGSNPGVGFINVADLTSEYVTSKILTARPTNTVNPGQNVPVKYDDSTNTLYWYPNSNSYIENAFNVSGKVYVCISFYE